MAASVGRHTDIHLSIYRGEACGRRVRADCVPIDRIGRLRRSCRWFN